MLVANSFDLWLNDSFFSAAEEVQQSADIMESVYRTWLSARREGLITQRLNELGRELQMALGTAKWQLEEFEKAVCLSYRNNGDDMTITRHKQFVSAIQGQISGIQMALKESLNVEGKTPFHWVNLDEEECDDLALFISGSPQRINYEGISMGPTVTSSLYKSYTKLHSPNHEKCSVEIHASNEDVNCELQERKSPVTADEISFEADQIIRDRGAWSSPDKTTLGIVIESDDKQENALIEVTPKEKGFKPFFWRSGGENYSGAKMKKIDWVDRLVRGSQRSQRQQMSAVLPVNSIRYVLALMLTIFLVVPFLVYST